MDDTVTLKRSEFEKLNEYNYDFHECNDQITKITKYRCSICGKKFCDTCITKNFRYMASIVYNQCLFDYGSKDEYKKNPLYYDICCVRCQDSKEIKKFSTIKCKECHEKFYTKKYLDKEWLHKVIIKKHDKIKKYFVCNNEIKKYNDCELCGIYYKGKNIICEECENEYSS